MEANAAIVQDHGCHVGFLDRPDRPAVAPGASINPIIEPPLQTVDHLLNVVYAEAGIERAPFVGLSISIGVFQEKYVRSDAGQQASLPRHDGSGKAKIIGKSRAMLVEPVAVPIFEELDLAGMDIPGAETAIRIAEHLGHIKSAVFVERNRDGINNVGFARD